MCTVCSSLESCQHPRYHAFEQLPGDAIFVPSRLRHTVQNLDPDTISANHNWINAANALKTWKFLLAEREIFREELFKFGAVNESLGETDSIEIMMKAQSGFGVRDWVACVQWGLQRATKHCLEATLPDAEQRNGDHKQAYHDLMTKRLDEIRHVMKSISTDPELGRFIS